jgi:outer membrane protein assembly factor BamB
MPQTWPDELQLKWKVPVGLGHASPIVVGDSVYVHARIGEDEAALCISIKNGKILWQTAYAAPYKINKNADGHGKGPKSTPLAYGHRLYTFGISGILSAFDRHSGKLLWQHDFSGEFNPSAPLFGTATSPIVVDEQLIVYVGGHERGALRAFDLTTGEMRWSWDGDGPGYTSPIVAEVAGVRQLITQSQGFNLGFDAQTGALLWQDPYVAIHFQNIVTPVSYDDILIFSGIDEGISAVRVNKDTEGWSTETVWHNTDVSMYMNSPVRRNKLLFGFSHKRKGQLFCLDLENGKTRWTGPGRMGDNALLVLSGDYLLALTTDGALNVVRATGEGFEPLAHYALADSQTWAHPALVDGFILIKEVEYLSLWSLP